MTWALSIDEVREAYILAADTTNADRDNGEDFDAWLAAHDAEVQGQKSGEPDWEYRISDGNFIHYTQSESRVVRAVQRGLSVKRRVPKREATPWEPLDPGGLK